MTDDITEFTKTVLEYANTVTSSVWRLVTERVLIIATSVKRWRMVRSVLKPALHPNTIVVESVTHVMRIALRDVRVQPIPLVPTAATRVSKPLWMKMMGSFSVWERMSSVPRATSMIPFKSLQGNLVVWLECPSVESVIPSVRGVLPLDIIRRWGKANNMKIWIMVSFVGF